MTAPIASGWSGCRVGLHPLESAVFARRTPRADIRWVLWLANWTFAFLSALPANHCVSRRTNRRWWRL